MVLTNAERQKKWREKRKSQNLEAFLAEERERKRKAYISVSELSEKELKKRRKAGRERERKSYYKRKERKAEEAAENSNSNNPNNEARHTRKSRPLAVSTPLVVKLPAVKRRYSRALRKAYRDIERLKEKNKELEKGKKKFQKRCERFASVVCRSEDNTYSADVSCETSESERTPLPLTPRSKSLKELRAEGLSPTRHKGVRKKLIMANSLIDAIKPLVKVKKNTKGNCLGRIRLDILKKYRCAAYVGKSLGVSRKKIKSVGSKRKCNTMKQRLQEVVTNFLEREDNCTTLPGKKDVKESKQKVVLSDYLHNLHEKFKIENPELKISRSCFCKMRPSHVLLACFSSRRTCLCSTHQNMALKIKSLLPHGVVCSKMPDVFIKQYETDEKLKEELKGKLGDEVAFKQWKKVNDGDKYRWKEVEERMPKHTFVEQLLKDLQLFRCHVQRVQSQYREIRRLRENLPAGEILLWMDFAENYTCASMEEVQSAYWNASMVSLHTMVAYFPGDRAPRNLQSYVAVSDVISHNATAVYAILKKIIPIIKEDYPVTKKIHYLTDSPTSQYRNKTIFQVLVDHETDFGMQAQWNYLESGHGKGPCDGLGASVKRAADMAIKQGKATIQDGKDFYNWTTKESGSKVKFTYYSQQDYDEAKTILESKQKCQAVSGTFKLHAVVPVDSVSIAVRDTSCYCSTCIKDVLNGCHGWKVNKLIKPVNEQDSEHPENTSKAKETETTKPVQANEPVCSIPEIGVFVAAVYAREWYIGKVTEVDEEEQEVQINFMTKAGKYGDTYKWPSEKDEIWIQSTHILMGISPPNPVGKTSRFFRIEKEVEEAISNKFHDYRKTP